VVAQIDHVNHVSGIVKLIGDLRNKEFQTLIEISGLEILYLSLDFQISLIVQYEI